MTVSTQNPKQTLNYSHSSPGVELRDNHVVGSTSTIKDAADRSVTTQGLGSIGDESCLSRASRLAWPWVGEGSLPNPTSRREQKDANRRASDDKGRCPPLQSTTGRDRQGFPGFALLPGIAVTKLSRDTRRVSSGALLEPRSQFLLQMPSPAAAITDVLLEGEGTHCPRVLRDSKEERKGEKRLIWKE